MKILRDELRTTGLKKNSNTRTSYSCCNAKKGNKKNKHFQILKSPDLQINKKIQIFY